MLMSAALQTRVMQTETKCFSDIKSAPTSLRLQAVCWEALMKLDLAVNQSSAVCKVNQNQNTLIIPGGGKFCCCRRSHLNTICNEIWNM